MKLESLHASKVNRRTFALGGAAAVAASTLGIAGVVAKQATPSAGTDQEHTKPDLRAYVYFWSATSPATHKGDTYTLVIKNTGSTAQKLYVRTIIMDHRAMINTPVISQELTLDPGAEQTLTATNDYGTANHFATRILTEADTDLDVKVSLTNAAGQVTATFTQGAFWIQSRQDMREQLKGGPRQRRQLRRHHRRHGRM
jgi:hypothetical protein